MEISSSSFESNINKKSKWKEHSYKIKFIIVVTHTVMFIKQYVLMKNKSVPVHVKNRLRVQGWLKVSSNLSIAAESIGRKSTEHYSLRSRELFSTWIF